MRLFPKVSSNVALINIRDLKNFDGKGYPNGISKKQIYLYPRIITLADVYDTLTSERPYKKAETPNKALEYILQNEKKVGSSDNKKKYQRNSPLFL